MYFFSKELSTFCFIFGALQIYFDPHTKTVRFSKKLFFWSLIVTASQVVFSIAAFVIDYNSYLQGHTIRLIGSKTSVVAVGFDLLPLGVTSLLIFVSAYILYPSLVTMFAHLRTVDKILNIEDRDQPKSVRTMQVSLTYITTCLCLFFASNYNPIYFVYIVPWSIYYSSISVTLCVSETAQSIDVRFQRVNSYLRKEVIEHSFGDFLDNRCLPPIEVAARGRPGALKSSQERLRQLTHAYWLLCACVTEANCYFGLQLLAAVLSSFLHNLSALFFVSVNLKHSARWLETSMHLVWVFNHTLYMLLLVWPCARVTEEADATAPIVCKLINRNPNSILKEQLELFLLQLLHRKATFTALGFFQVNKVMLTSLAGAAATYLAIMIQFQEEYK